MASLSPRRAAHTHEYDANPRTRVAFSRSSVSFPRCPLSIPLYSPPFSCFRISSFPLPCAPCLPHLPVHVFVCRALDVMTASWDKYLYARGAHAANGTLPWHCSPSAHPHGPTAQSSLLQLSVFPVLSAGRTAYRLGQGRCEIESTALRNTTHDAGKGGWERERWGENGSGATIVTQRSERNTTRCLFVYQMHLFFISSVCGAKS